MFTPSLPRACLRTLAVVRAGKEARTAVTLTSAHSDQSYLYKMQTTNKGRYSVKPSHGLLSKGSTSVFKVSVDKANCAELMADPAGIHAAVRSDKFQLLLCPLPADRHDALLAKKEASDSKKWSSILKTEFKALPRNKATEVKVKLPPSGARVQFAISAP